MGPKREFANDGPPAGCPPPQPPPTRGEGDARHLEPRSKGKGKGAATTGFSVPSPLAGEGEGGGYREQSASDGPQPHLHNNPPPPTLTEVVTTLNTLGKIELPAQLTRWLDELDETGRWALLKLVTGAMRIGVSARLAQTAAAELTDKDPRDSPLMCAGPTPP